MTLIEFDPEPGEELRNLRIIRRRLAADPDVTMVALGAGYGEAQHFEHAGVAFIEIEGDDLGIAVDSQGQLRQVVGADRKAVELLGEGVDLNDVVGDLAHHVDLQAVLAAQEPVLRHCRDHLLGFGDAAAERHHDLQIDQTHFIADPGECLAFECEAGGVGRVRVARGAAKAEHRVVLFRLEPGAADQAGILIGLEVRQPDDDRLGKECRGDRADALGELFDEKIDGLRIIPHELCDRGPRRSRGDLVR